MISSKMITNLIEINITLRDKKIENLEKALEKCKEQRNRSTAQSLGDYRSSAVQINIISDDLELEALLEGEGVK